MPRAFSSGRRVDLVVGLVLRRSPSPDLGDRRGQRRLAVVDVTDRADVHVRLRALELCLRHPWLPFLARRRPLREAREIVAIGENARCGARRAQAGATQRTNGRKIQAHNACDNAYTTHAHTIRSGRERAGSLTARLCTFMHDSADSGSESCRTYSPRSGWPTSRRGWRATGASWRRSWRLALRDLGGYGPARPAHAGGRGAVPAGLWRGAAGDAGRGTVSARARIAPAAKAALGAAHGAAGRAGDDASSSTRAAPRSPAPSGWRRGVTVVTHAPAIAAALVENEGVRLVTLGGQVDRQVGAALGGGRAGGDRGDSARPLAPRRLRDRRRRGITAHSPDDAAVKRAVAARAGRVAVAADLRKLETAAPFAVIDLAACDLLLPRGRHPVRPPRPASRRAGQTSSTWSA